MTNKFANDWERYYYEAETAAKEMKLEYAETMWLAALMEAQLFGEADNRLVLTLEGLAEIYWSQGKFRNAEQLAKRVYDIYVKHKAEPMDLGVAAQNLAMTYHRQEKYGQAEPLYKQAIEIKTKVLGAQHPDVADVLSRYAELLQKTHREAEAANLQVCITGMKTGKWTKTKHQIQLPPRSTSANPVVPNPLEHAAVAQSQSSSSHPASPAPAHFQAPPQPAPQAASHQAPNSQHQHAQPQGFMQGTPAPIQTPPQAFMQQHQAPPVRPVSPTGGHTQENKTPSFSQTRTGEFSSNPPSWPPRPGLDTPPTPAHLAQQQHAPTAAEWNEMSAFARTRAAAGHHADAARAWTEALRIAESTGQNQFIAMSLDGLGEACCQTERYAEAEEAWVRSLHIKWDALGAYHLAVATTTNNLAKLHYLLGRYAEAESFGNKCVEIYERVQGPEHPDVAWALNNLATMYHVKALYPEAERCYQRALAIRKKALGEHHEDTIKTQKAYNELLTTTGKKAAVPKQDLEAGGLITGSWKAISLPSSEQLNQQNTCNFCGKVINDLKKCPACGTPAGSAI